MKRFNWLVISLTAMLVWSSCESRRFQFVATLNRTVDFPVDQTGAFSTVRTITAAQMRSNLNVPEDATIIRVDIEALSLVPETLANNQAAEVKVSGYVKDQGKNLYMFKDKSINLKTGVDVGWGLRVPLTTLIEEGVASLKNKINDHVKRINDANIEIGLSGDTVPGGKRLLMKVHFEIKATILYEQCVDTPSFFGGEKCEKKK